MKVLCILTGGLKNDGITNSVLLYYSYMDKSDISIDLLDMGQELEESVINKTKEADVNLKKIVSRRNVILYLVKLYELIKKEKYDIVHVHGSSSLMCLELLASKLAGCKVRIAHSRNTTCSHIIIHKVLKPFFSLLCTHRFACGYDAGKWLFGKKEFIVLHNGKNLNDYSFSNMVREKVRETYGWKNKYIIGHVANFNYQKNHKFLINIFFEYLKVNKESHLILIGRETEAGYLKKAKDLINSLKIEDSITFMGSINNVSEILNGMDLMLLPSYFEGLPNVVIEGQISGLPCIISDSITRECSVTDLVSFISIDNVTDWVNKITKIQQSSFDREKSSKNSIERFKEEGFEIVNNSKKLKSLYFEFVNEM